MHPKYTNVKCVFLYIKIYEKRDFGGSQAKLAAYAWFFLYTVVLLKRALLPVCADDNRDSLALSSGGMLSLRAACRRLSFRLGVCRKWAIICLRA